MLWSDLHPNEQFELVHPKVSSRTLRVSGMRTPQSAYPTPIGTKPETYRERGQGVIGPKGAQCAPLLVCAAVIYVYTAGGEVANVSIYHAFSGDFDESHDPLGLDLNPDSIIARDVHVVFASSCSTRPVGNSGFTVYNSSAGIFDLVDMGIPPGNIVLTYDTGAFYGANALGEIGQSSRPTWQGGDLGQLLAAAVADARAAYNSQFRVGQTKIGVLGSGHNKNEAATRLTTLVDALDSARGDEGRLRAVRALLDGPHSYKAGSLKLALVRALWANLRPDDGRAITPENAQAEGATLLREIAAGN
jgi:hypothetical protein